MSADLKVEEAQMNIVNDNAEQDDNRALHIKGDKNKLLICATKITTDEDIIALTNGLKEVL